MMRCLKSSQFVCPFLSLVVFLDSVHVMLVLSRPENDPRIGHETVIYGYGSCATPTSARLHCELLTRSLVRMGALYEEERK
jgi:hypothetical protein